MLGAMLHLLANYFNYAVNEGTLEHFVKPAQGFLGSRIHIERKLPVSVH